MVRGRIAVDPEHMSESAKILSALAQIAVIVAGFATAVGIVAWLIGLAIVMRGTTPRQRPAILRAYRMPTLTGWRLR